MWFESPFLELIEMEGSTTERRPAFVMRRKGGREGEGPLAQSKKRARNGSICV